MNVKCTTPPQDTTTINQELVHLTATGIEPTAT